MIDLKELEKIIEIEQEALKKKAQNEQSDNPSAPIKRQNREVLSFIRKTGLSPGDNKVPNYVLYYHFMKWSNARRWNRLWGKEEFFRTFKQHFEQKRSGNQRFYLINDALDLSDEIYEKAKKYDQKYQKRKQKI